jgi:hypothetical protein
METGVLAAITWADAGLAIGTGLIATAAWTGLVLLWQRSRRRRSLCAFVGDYESHARHNAETDEVQIRTDGDELCVDLKNKRGPARGRITLSDRFPKSGRGAYEHHFSDGDLGWGTWNVHLVSTGEAILVTTRYPDPKRQVEVVQGFEWRRIG